MQSVEFVGRSVLEAKRRALNYWYVNRGSLDLSLSQFFGRCRAIQLGSEIRIIYSPPRPGSAPQGPVKSWRAA